MVAYTMKMLLRHAISFRYPRYDNQLYKLVKFFFYAPVFLENAQIYSRNLCRHFGPGLSETSLNFKTKKELLTY